MAVAAKRSASRWPAAAGMSAPRATIRAHQSRRVSSHFQSAFSMARMLRDRFNRPRAPSLSSNQLCTILCRSHRSPLALTSLPRACAERPARREAKGSASIRACVAIGRRRRFERQQRLATWIRPGAGDRRPQALQPGQSAARVRPIRAAPPARLFPPPATASAISARSRWHRG